MISARVSRRGISDDLGLGFSLRSLIQKVSVPVGTAVGTVFGNPVAGAAAGAAAAKLAQKKEDDAPAAAPTPAGSAAVFAPSAAPKSKLPWLIGGGVATVAFLTLIIYLAARRPSAPVFVTTGKTNPRRSNPRSVFYTMRDIKMLLRRRKAVKKTNPAGRRRARGLRRR